MNRRKLLKGKNPSGQTKVQALPAGVEEVEGVAELLSDREERLQALKLMFGAWKGRTDIPNDGLAFQEQLRSE